MNLDVVNVKKNFKKKQVLKNISFKLSSGKIYGLLGLNGAGKTTLIKCLFNELYFQGNFFLDNQKMNKSDYKNIYYFPENNDLPQNLSLYEYLYRIYMLSGKNKKNFLDKLNIETKILSNFNLKKTKISSLSSGQQKILSLIACQLADPKIIIFDEPTANLDIANKQTILKTIIKMKKNDNIIVLTTHLIDEVNKLIDHAIIIHNGIVSYDNEVIKKENLKKIFLKIINYNEEKLYE